MRQLICLLFIMIASESFGAYFPLDSTFFSDGLKSLTLEETASTQPTPASGKAKMYVKNGSLTVLDDTGTEAIVGTGAGGSFDYVTNSDAEVALSGWSNTVGGADFKVERNTSSPLKGTGDFKITVTASATIDDYISYPITINDADMLTKMITVSIDAIKYATGSYANGDIQVCLYDVTAARCLRTDHFIDTSPKFAATVQVGNNASLELRFYLKVVKAMTLQLEGIHVQPQAPSVTGLAGWKQYDISSYMAISLTGTPDFIAFAYPYKDLDGNWRTTLNLIITVNETAPAARTSMSFTISGLTYKNGSQFFQAVSVASSTATGTIIGQTTPNTSTITMYHPSANTLAYRVSADVALESKPTWAVDYSNVVLSSSTSNREASHRANVVNTTAVTASAAIVPYTIVSTGKQNGSSAISFDAGTYTWTINEDGWYLVSTTYRINATATAAGANYQLYPVISNNTSGDLPASALASETRLTAAYASATTLNESNSAVGYFVKGATIVFKNDHSGLTSPTYSSSIADNSVRITKLNTGSQTIGKLPVLFEKYNTIASTISNSLTTGGTIIATNKVRSTHGAYNPATGIFTAPDDRLYEVCFAVRHDSPTAASGNTFVLLVGGDGVATSNFNHHISMLTATTVRHNGCTTFYGTKGEQAWLRAFHLNAVGTEPFNGLAQYNWITWRSVD